MAFLHKYTTVIATDMNNLYLVRMTYDSRVVVFFNATHVHQYIYMICP